MRCSGTLLRLHRVCVTHALRLLPVIVVTGQCPRRSCTHLIRWRECLRNFLPATWRCLPVAREVQVPLAHWHSDFKLTVRVMTVSDTAWGCWPYYLPLVSVTRCHCSGPQAQAASPTWVSDFEFKRQAGPFGASGRARTTSSAGGGWIPSRGG